MMHPTTIQLSPTSSVGVYRNTLPISREEFDELRAVMEAAAPTPNPYRPSTNILRKQAVFAHASVVGDYTFGQVQDTIRGTLESMPMAVQRAFEASRWCQQENKDSNYAIAQCNLYENGRVGISPHADDESFLAPNCPIYSYTFQERPDESPRPFSIYTLDEKKILDIPLFHGDMLVMSGNMQQEFKHGIEKDRPSKYGKRINLTVRSVAQ